MVNLVAQPLSSAAGFNWVFLVEILVCAVLALFFLFYFNRLFATLISYGIRAYTWHKYRAYIDISALQFSLLGGRLFFKSVRYHAHNITVLVHDGHITWRYWLRSVQEAEIFDEQPQRNGGKADKAEGSGGSEQRQSSSEGEKPRSRSIGKEEKGGVKQKKVLPPRISVKVNAVEAFVYNRSPAFDILVEQASKAQNTPDSSAGTNDKHAGSPGSSDQDEKAGIKIGVVPEKTETQETVGLSPVDTRPSNQKYQQPEIPSWLRIFPVKVECKRAAAAVGNEHTTSVVTAKLEKAVGSIDAGHAGPYDLYKLLFNFEFEKIHVAMKPNRDFKERQFDAAQHILREKELQTAPTRDLPYQIFFDKSQRRWHKFTSAFKRRKSASGSVRTASLHSTAVPSAAALHDQIPGQAQWHGLARYLDDREATEHDDWKPIEYAKASTLADIPRLSFRFYWDIPGQVPYGMTDSEMPLGSKYRQDINGSKPPDYWLDFGVHGGTVVYGPWADRQRQNLQPIFFPASYVDAVPEQPLKPGDTRVTTIFKIFVSVEEDVVLRLPTREESKDDRWKGRASDSMPGDQAGDDGKKHGKHRHRHRRHKGKQGTSGVDARPYGWIDISVKTDTTVNYVMDMFPRPSGFKNTLDVEVKGIEMTSSVNHGLLWRSGALTLDADLSYPLEWNTVRRWPFNIVCDDLQLYILRDHLFLIIDLVNDWASGPPPDFYTFVPFFYHLDLLFRNFCMYLNVNDANIINDPAELDRNDFLTLEGKSLRGVLGIPLEHYRPKNGGVNFDVLAHEMKMRILSPPRSTLNTLVKDTEVAVLPKLTLNGSFASNTEERAGNTDILQFDIVGSGLDLKAYGFLVRQLINIKENYFGDYTHFKTLEEFQGASDDLAEANAKTASIQKPKTINELDTILRIVAEDVTVMLPTNLYNCDEYVQIELPQANLDLRITSYYLDMGLNLSPISFLSGSTKYLEDDDSPVESASSTQMYIGHVDLGGHRAFGLPPNEPTYLSEWNIDVGKISGECSAAFCHDLVLALQAFVFTFQDGENALPISSPNVFHDVTFVRVKTDVVRLWLHVGKDALLVSSQPVSVITNDWCGDQFSQRVTVLAPRITLAIVDARSASRHRVRAGRRMPVRTYAFFQTGASINVIGRKAQFEEERRKQQDHIKRSDIRTRRVPFLIRDDGSAAVELIDGMEDKTSPAVMAYPSLPLPMDRSGTQMQCPASIKSIDSFVTGKPLRSKPSVSSLSASIRGPERLLRPLPLSSLRDSEDSRSRRGSSRESFASLTSAQDGAIGADRERARFGLPPSSVAFASSFAEPYFPLDLVEPDESDVPAFIPDVEEMGAASETSSIYENAEDAEFIPDTELLSVIVRLVPGVRVYIEPRAAAMAAKLVRKALPKTPGDVMDAFQMKVLGTISSRRQERHGHNSILDLHIDLPAARLRALHRTDGEATADQLDLDISRLEQAVRVRKQPLVHGASQKLSLHTAGDGIKLSLCERRDAQATAPTVMLNVSDIIVWVATGESQSIHASVRELDVLVHGDNAKYMALLALRVMPLVRDIASRFTDVFETDRRRLLLLIWTLTQHSEDVGDPPYLSRMTYILRAFPDHYRNQDSWKVLARFRHILDSLPRKALDELEEASKLATFECPEDAPARVLESWGQWRNWDVPNVSQTLAFKMLFGGEGTDMLARPMGKPLTLSVRSEYARLAIQSVSKTSEIVLEETSLDLDSTPPTAPTGLMLLEENKRTNTLMHMHADVIAISLDWSLSAIAESILPLIDRFKQVAESRIGSGHRNPSEVLEDGLNRQDFHVVLSTETGTIWLQSINLRHLSRAEGLKMSLIGTTQGDERYGQCASALINVDSAVTELHGPSSRIWHTLLTSPSLYIDHLESAPGLDLPPSITIAVAYTSLELAITQQVPGILQVIDSVIVNEVGTVMKLVDAAKPRVDSTVEHSQQQPSHKPEEPARLNVALLAGQLEVEVLLLQALSYRLEGTPSSIRVEPSLTGSGTFTIDFDLGQQSHSFVNLSKNERHGQGVVELPPIVGQVGFQVLEQETSLSITTSIKRVEVDAAAIQSIVAVVNKPEVKNVFSAAQAEVEDIQHHVADLKGTAKEQLRKTSAVQKKLTFDARLALLGVRVSASTPQIRGRSTTEVEFGIGPLHATASNRKAFDDVNPLIPDVRAQIQDIGARLWTDEGGRHLPCGHVTLGMLIQFTSKETNAGAVARALNVRSDGLEVNAYPETAANAIDVINHLQDRIRDLDLSKEIEYLKKLRDDRRSTNAQTVGSAPDTSEDAAFSAEDLLSITTTIQLSNVHITWLVAQRFASTNDQRADDAVLSLESIDFTTRGGHEAKLTIRNTMLQLTKGDRSREKRSLNSALLPEVGFSVGYWSGGKKFSFAFKASGKPLDLRLESRFLRPVSAVQKSINFAVDQVKTATATWQGTPTVTGAPRSSMLDTKRIASLLVEADFAGAHVYMQGGRDNQSTPAAVAASAQEQGSQKDKYGEFAAEEGMMFTSLKSPGIALKVEYNATERQPTVNGELRIDASSNTLLPNVVPLLLEVSDSVKEIVRDQGESTSARQGQPSPDTKTTQKFFEDESLITANPAHIFGKTKVDLGLRLCRQEFGLSCQPIARVDAKAALDDFYFTVNTIESDEHGHFFAMSAVATRLTASVKHVYSREPTFSYDMDSITLSLMNNKHLSGVNGVSAIVKVNPTKLSINGKQLQDLLLFREIWLPPEMRNPQPQPAMLAPVSNKPDDYLMQRYQTVAAAAAFPWNATVSIAELSVELDLGQSIGKSSFNITNLWASQQKSSNWEQNLCIGLDEMGMTSTGRMSGFILLSKLGVRTSIKWPEDSNEYKNTPLIQASLGFQRLRAKAAFDYQAFAFGDIEGFDFLMYNVRETQSGTKDRLVAVVDCEKAYVFCTSTSPAQAVGLYQAFDRLIEEKQKAYMQSLKDVEKHLRRESVIAPPRPADQSSSALPPKNVSKKPSHISLHTDVVLTMGTISFGVYPSTFFDSQLLKLEANNIQARFAVGLEKGRVHSGLGMTLGQLQVGLAAVKRVSAVPKGLDVTVDEVITSAVSAKGGTIVRVPQVVASMQTWQTPDSNSVDYIFRSLFDGKIDVGWNLNRINFIQGMWTTHTRSLASRLGRTLPKSAVKITAGAESAEERTGEKKEAQEKITAEVNLPQSRYEYTPLEPPIIETPQLRDMGEATPPLEWIGLQRERLPHVTHQIIIVSLLEVAKEVEEAYERILGSS